MIAWTTAAPAVSAAFLGSLVEAVEALTIVLAVATVRGWRPAGLGALAGLGSLALIVLVLGPFLDRVPLDVLQLVIGVLLLLFGMRWLSKAILRAAGIIPLHDEAFAFAAGTAELRSHEARLAWLAGLASFKAVLLEGLEVAFIVIAFGAKGVAAMNAAIVGAIAAGVIVVVLAAALRAPLTAVPENWMKFGVGAMLSSFGVFWFGEGIGAHWPGDAASIPVILAAFLAASWLCVRLLQSLVPEGARVEARNV